MNIKQIGWDSQRNQLSIEVDNIYLLLVFDRKNLGNKYLVLGNVKHIFSSTSPLYMSGYLPPIRNLQKFMRQIILRYDGNTDVATSWWIKNERKRITKDIKV